MGKWGWCSGVMVIWWTQLKSGIRVPAAASNREQKKLISHRWRTDAVVHINQRAPSIQAGRRIYQSIMLRRKRALNVKCVKIAWNISQISFISVRICLHFSKNFRDIIMSACNRGINRFVQFISCGPNDAGLFSKDCSGSRRDSNTREILLNPLRLSPGLVTL